MQRMVRFVGVLNASVWFGALLFFTLGAGPAFFSEAMIRLLTKPYAGASAQVVIERLFTLQLVCCVIAWLHLLGEWLYTGRPFPKVTAILLGVLLAMGLFGSNYLQPKLKGLHVQKYSPRSTPAQKEEAALAFSKWHGISQSANLLVLGCTLFYLWQMTMNLPPQRFGSAARVRP